MVWSSDVSVESEQLRPCWNYLLVWACGHLQRQLTDGQMDIWLSLPASSPSEHRFLLLYVFFIHMFDSSAKMCSPQVNGTLSCFSWDESSSISSGLSDGDGEGSENLSSEEFNASSSLNSLPSTPLGSRRNSSAMVSWNTIPDRLRQRFASLCLVYFVKAVLKIAANAFLSEAFLTLHPVIYFVLCAGCETTVLTRPQKVTTDLISVIKPKQKRNTICHSAVNLYHSSSVSCSENDL